MMKQSEITDAVDGVMALRGGDAPMRNTKSLALHIDHIHDDLAIKALEEGRVEPELLGVNLTRTDYRYTSDKQLDSARNAAKSSTFGR